MMKAQATRLYPFVPSGPRFTTSLAFFGELGFEKLWEHDGLAGLRFGGAYFMLQDIDVPEWQASVRVVGRTPHVSKHQDAAQLRASGHGR